MSHTLHTSLEEVILTTSKKAFSNFVENVKQKGTSALVPCEKGLAGENDCAPLI